MFIWFQHLLADWQLIRRPELKDVPFVFAVSDHGRLTVAASSCKAEQVGVEKGMRIADAKAICPKLEVFNAQPSKEAKLLKGLGEWCIRFSPTVAIDNFSYAGLILDISGCTHLWGDEQKYLNEVTLRFKRIGYLVKCAIADTPGGAYAVARFGKTKYIIESGEHTETLCTLPPEALRIDDKILHKLQKLGFYQIKSLINIPRSVLRRRFGEDFLSRFGQAFGIVEEMIEPLKLPCAFQERLSCLEPIKHRIGIEIAIKRLLTGVCGQLEKQGMGMRKGVLKCYRIDGHIVQIDIGTNSATNNINHLNKLFELKIDKIQPALGIELFILESTHVEVVKPTQDVLWTGKLVINDKGIIELLDRIAGKYGSNVIHRYLPAERYWPERSIKDAASIEQKPESGWRTDRPRPTELLIKPEPIDVMALVPDHPPKFFVYKSKQHQVIKADGPERIEREWWVDSGEHRDYYCVEDELGQRYWLFRSGHYSSKETYHWFIHGFFA